MGVLTTRTTTHGTPASHPPSLILLIYRQIAAAALGDIWISLGIESFIACAQTARPNTRLNLFLRNLNNRNPMILHRT